MWCHDALALDSLCATVKLDISQDLILERQAFDATMRIGNGLPGASLENVDITVHATDQSGNAVLISSDPNATGASFFIRLDSMTNISDVSGAGTVAPSTEAEIHWLIIPAADAAQDSPTGKTYFVGATLAYTLNGTAHSVTVDPDSILVKPLPLLSLDYFVPQDVYADDPFTTLIEPAIPFSIGLRVRNTGLGVARSVSVESAQPRIVENEDGLLIGFLIEGAEVNGVAAGNTLLAHLGDIGSNSAATARWSMTTTLSGRFEDFSVTFTHSDELGGKVTSLVSGVNSHSLVHDVMADLAGRDLVRDFLADDTGTLTMYESQNVDTPVTDVSGSASLVYAGQSGTEISYSLSATAASGYSYVKLVDPTAGQKVVKWVGRSDGKQIRTENVWLSQRRHEVTKEWEYFFHLFDGGSTGTYTVIFDAPPAQAQPPVLQFVADQTLVEGEELTLVIAATDADGTIPALSAAPLPAGASFADAGTGSGTFSWTPAIGQAGSYEVTFTASDGSLTHARRATITVRHWWDTDGDGMADAWELQHFGSLDRDGSGDADGDGVSDLDEYLAGTDPNTGLAPSVPIVLAPAEGSEVVALQPQLEVKTSVDRDGGALGLRFEVFADAAMTQLAASADVAPGAGTTVWDVDSPLADNAWHWWRVRAGDGAHLSAWAYGRFFVNAANDAPEAATLSAPRDGASVDTASPVLQVTNARDADGDVVTYAFELFGDAGLTAAVASASGIAAGSNGVSSWTVSPALTDGLQYWWRSTATDAHGASTSTAVGSFTVDTANQAPTAAAIAAPESGSEVMDPAVTLTAGNATDAGGASLTYQFEIDTTDSFNSANLIRSAAVVEGSGTTSWTVPAALGDNTRYHWRVRASDGAADGPWSSGAFFVNTANDAPATPTVRNPSDGGEVWTRSPELALNPATDADEDALTYDYEVYADAGLTALVTSAVGQGEGLVWTVPVTLTADHSYYWRARAADVHGAASAWTPAMELFVNLEGYNDPPTIAFSRPAAAEPRTNATGFEIVWTDADPDGNASIALFYDADGTGFDGVPITAGIEENDAANAYPWNTSTFLDGTYYVYAVIADEENETRAYAPGPLVIDRTAPVASAAPAGGVYGAAQTVALAAGEPATIYYTTDGSDPTTASSVFSAPIPVGANAVLRFFAVDEAGNAGAVAAESYVIDTVPPSGAIVVNGGATITNSAALSLSLTFADGESAVVSMRFGEDGVSWGAWMPAAASAAWPLSAGDGLRSVWAQFRDAGGNESGPVSDDIELDTVAPAVAIDPPPDPVVQTSWTVTGTREAAATVTLGVSGTATVGTVTYPGASAWSCAVSGLAEGPNTLTATATDSAGNDGTAVATLTVDLNYPPVLDPIGARTVNENELLSFTVTASDPDGTTPSLTAQNLPAGASFAAGTFTWTPSYDQSGDYPVTFVAGDGEFEDSEVVTITAVHVNRAPTVPLIVSPQTRSEVTALRPSLTLENSIDPDGEPLAYEFEVYADQAMTTPVCAASVPGTAGSTAWPVTADLADNAWHYWRARAADGLAFSQWTDGEFFVNTANDAPGPFAVAAPADGTDVASVTPALQVGNSVDVDGDALWYSFQVYDDEAMTNPVDAAAGIPPGAGASTEWTVAVPLADNTWHFWRAVVTDEHGLATQTAASTFFVNTANDAPSAPAVGAPAHGSEVASTSVTLTVANAVDVDGDVPVYFFELDTAPTFDGAGRILSGPVAEGSGATWWSVSNLADNTRYHWRSKAADGWVESPWATAEFFVNTVNDAPGAPTLRNPGAAAWVESVTPRLEVYAAADADEDALTYEFEVYADPPGAPVAFGGSAATEWVVSPALADNAWHAWRSRAVDAHGLPGPWTAVSAFFTNNNGVDDPPAITVTEPAGAYIQAGGTFPITWVDGDPDSDARVALYFDTDGVGANGTPIVADLSEDLDGTAGSWAWNLDGVAVGTYFVYGVITDGTTTRTDYAPGTVTVDGAAPATVATPGPGTYVSQVTVALTATDDIDPDPVIHYTTDGTTPTLASAVYAGPLTFTETTDLHFFAVDASGRQEAVQGPFRYTLVPPTIHASAGANGTISPAGSVTVPRLGSQTFVITPDTNYRIAQVVVDGNPVGPVSSYAFTDVTADHTIVATFTTFAAVTVLAPNGGESIASGSSYTIRWGAPSAATSFDLSYSLDGGSSFSAIATRLTGYRYEWTVPAPADNRSQCLVRVVGKASRSTVGTDVSDQVFTIEVVRVEAPDGGESFSRAATPTVPITWTTNATSQTVNKVALSYSTNGGGTWNAIGTLTSDPGSYAWTLPGTDGSQYRVRVQLYRNNTAVGSDASDANFAVGP